MIPKSKCVVAFLSSFTFPASSPILFIFHHLDTHPPTHHSCPYYLSPSLIQTAQLKPLRGFDRLTTAGFSEEEIANVRAQFHSSRGLGATESEEDGDGAIQRDEDDSESIRCFWLEGV